MRMGRFRGRGFIEASTVYQCPKGQGEMIVGDDAGDGHVEGLVDVDEGGAVLEDGGDEFVHKIAV